MPEGWAAENGRGGTGWDVSEVGYGMWGMGGWSGSDDAQSLAAPPSTD